MARLAASFRDPAGQVFEVDGRIFRSVTKGDALDHYRAARDAGLYSSLVDAGMLVDLQEVDAPDAALASDRIGQWLEHPRLPFISQPYEWPFTLWKKAALLQLDLHLKALEQDFTLIDATAYNVQFDGVRPVFIDHLSIRPYREGEAWIGHHQFCSQYLCPLLMHSKCGVAPNGWMRGSLEGIMPGELAPLLPFKARLSPTVLAHIFGLAAIERQRAAGKTGSRAAKLPKARLTAMLQSLGHFIEGLTPPGGVSTWGDYADHTSYSDADAADKHRFVGEFVAATKPGLLIDIGCNSGDYSVTALDAGAGRVIGFDFDHIALERACARAEAKQLALTPLWLDAANPSPSQGWAQRERPGFNERVRADAMVGLAVIHHIAIGRNVPLDDAIDWLMAIAPAGVIEFPTKEDPMVQTLLSQRDDIFPDYHADAFRAAVERRGKIIAEADLIGGKRRIVRYQR